MEEAPSAASDENELGRDSRGKISAALSFVSEVQSKILN